MYQSGQTITMTGDDDIWVFIDNKLALDQGGVQPPRTGTINLDTLALTPGKTYNFDLFFAERHTTQSSLGIETNIPLIPSTPQQCDATDAVNDSAFATTGPNTIHVTNNDVEFSSISAFTQPIHGSVNQVGTSLVYTPTLGFEGIDFFTYTIVNNSGDTDTAVVNVVALADGICPSTPESYNLIMGDDDNNNLRGTDADDLIIGMGGNDKIQGKKGNDCLVGGNGNDKMWGGDGNDTIIAGNE
ncbi:MAG: fibro-slime domain-containing protein, partial [Candidatus Nitrosotenuis sp.]